jgi:hypothetical protein
VTYGAGDAVAVGITGEVIAVEGGAILGTGEIVAAGTITGVGVVIAAGVGVGLETTMVSSVFEHPAIKRRLAMIGRNFIGMAKDVRGLLRHNYGSITSV